MNKMEFIITTKIDDKIKGIIYKYGSIYLFNEITNYNYVYDFPCNIKVKCAKMGRYRVTMRVEVEFI